MAGPVHHRIEACLLDWLVLQDEVDWWESRKRAYVEANRPNEAPKGEWAGMKAESQASWDQSISLRWEIDDIDLSRDMYGMHLEAVNAAGAEMDRRHLGYFASQAEARLFAAALLLISGQRSLEDTLRAGGFTFVKADAQAARWKRRLKSGELSLSVVPERNLSGRLRFDRELRLVYAGRRAQRILPIVFSCAAWDHSGADNPERAPHPATGVVDDPFAADVQAALAVAEARLARGNIRKPLTDGQEVAFIGEMIARHDASPDNRALLEDRTADIRPG